MAVAARASLSACTQHRIHEQLNAAHEKQSQGISLTTAIIAVLLAIATMLANSANTNKVVIETKIADGWAFTHSNGTNARMYMAKEPIAQLHGEKEAAEEFHSLYRGQKKDSNDARMMGKLEKDSGLKSRKAHWFESGELSRETSTVLCSIALLTELRPF